jgi:heat shock protein HslJ
MKYILFLLAACFAFPAFAIFQEGSSDACTLPDGSFREECMYMTGMPTTPKMSPRAALQAGIWESVSLNGRTITGATLQFGKNRFHAKICNTMNGAYGAVQDRLIFRQVISTRMYCGGDIMQLEDAMSFTRARFMVGSETLTITTKKGDVIVWKKK